ncbi:unnamed protein product [Closterium sp. NIES-53]
MASQHLVLGLRRVFASLPPSPAPPCTPCVTGHLRATPHSSSLRPATAPFQTLHLDVWGVGPTLGPERDRYFLVVVDDYSRYTTVFPLAKKSEVASTLIRGFTDKSLDWVPWCWVGLSRLGLPCAVSNTSADKLSARSIPRVFLGFPVGSPDYSFYHLPLHQFLDSCDIRLDESVSYYTWYPCRGLPVPPPPLFLAPSHPPAPAPPVPPPPPGPAPSVVSHATPPLLVARQVASPSSQSSSQSLQQPSALPRQVTMDSVGIGAGGAAADGTRSGGARSRGAGARGASAVGASSGGAGAGGSGTGGASSGGTGAGGAGTEETGAGGSPTERPHRHDTRFQTLRRLEREE